MSVGAHVIGDFTDATLSVVAGTSTWATELAAILEQTKDWYCLIPAQYSYTDAIAAADFVSANYRVMAITIHDAQAITTSEIGLAHVFSNAAYDRVVPYFHSVYGTHLAAASMGERLPTVPGNGTLKFKNLSGIAADSLTQTAITNLTAKNINYYVEYGGLAIVAEGTVASGEFFDIIRGVDWLQARIMESVYARLANLPKVPYTDQGFAIVESAIREVLSQGIRNGLLIDNENLTVTIPTRDSLPFADRVSRTLSGVSFTADLQGAVHFVKITGTVTV